MPENDPIDVQGANAASELDPIDVHVGNALRDIRRSRDLSLEGLAEKVGVTYQQIQKYEKGKNRMSSSTLYRIALILQVSPMRFFPPAPNSDKPGHRPEDVEVSNTIAKIGDPRVRERLHSLIDSLAPTPDRN